MKFTIITLFPDLYQGFLQHSIIKNALQKKIISIEILDLRQFGIGKHKQVDDYQFGGGAGMVLMAPIVVAAIESVQTTSSKTFLLSPQGQTWQQQKAIKMSKESHIILVCGHYEGFDERIRDYVDGEISIGDFITTGGELPAMIVVDSIARLIPGVISEKAHIMESFTDGLLDHPVYTKPLVFRGNKVPDVLLSGHHSNIKEWRHRQSIIKTQTKRPDLILKQKRKAYNYEHESN